MGWRRNGERRKIFRAFDAHSEFRQPFRAFESCATSPAEVSFRMDNLWPELPPAAAANVDSALARGNKIDAIKIYRDATHCGLKEAKEAIERGDAKPAFSSANPIITRTTGPNWLTMVLALIILAIIAAIILLRK
jgi:hypothetical protein